MQLRPEQDTENDETYMKEKELKLELSFLIIPSLINRQ